MTKLNKTILRKEDIIILQNLLKNGGFQDGVLEPWVGSNAYITPQSYPNMPKSFSVVLKGKRVNASIERTINVMPGESYDLTISAAANRWGISPPIKILLEYLDSSGQHIEDGIYFSMLRGQLSNWNSCHKRTFKTIHQNSLKVPADAYWGKLTIMKIALPYTTSLVIDNIALTRVEAEISLPTSDVNDTETSPVSDADLDAITVDKETVATVQVTPDSNQYIYIVNENGMLSVIQASDNTVIKTIDFPGRLSYQENQNILVSSDNSTTYAVNQSSSTTSLTKSIELEGKSVTLILTNDRQSNLGLLYVIDHDSHSVSVIDTSTNMVIDNFKLDRNYPNHLAIILDNQ